MILYCEMLLYLLVFGFESGLVHSLGRTCTVPDIPVNSELAEEKHEFEHGDSVRYTCKEGYVTSGNPVRRCNHGSWTVVNFICHGNCTLLYLDKNIELTSVVGGLTAANGSNVSPNTKLFVKCKPDYEVYNSIKDDFLGNVTVTCANLDTLPTCAEKRCWIDGTLEGHCYHPPKKQWCYKKRFDVRSGKTVSLRCTGSHTITQLDGIKQDNDDNNRIQCTRGVLTPRYRCDHSRGRTCGFPDFPLNSELLKPVGVDHVFRNGDIVDYRCKTGFSLSGNRMRRCRNGTWTHVRFTCDAVCPPLYDIQHGSIFPDGWPDHYESVAKYTCKPGFRIFGKDLEYQRVCQLNGTWSGSEPYCEAVMCDEIHSLPGGDVYYPTGRNEHSSAIFECYDGYILYPEETLTSKCEEISGKFMWSPKPPICRQTHFKYVVRMQVADELHAGTDGNVYVRIHGLNEYAEKFRMKGVFGRNRLEETEFRGLEIRPIHKVVVEVGNGIFGEDLLCLVYVSIFIEHTDEYYVFKNKLHWIRAYTPESIYMSEHPERCVHTYSNAMKRSPKIRGRTGFLNSLRECKQRCATTLSMTCNGIYFMPRRNHNKGFGDCYHYSNSPDSDHFRNNSPNETLDHYMSYQRICRLP